MKKLALIALAGFLVIGSSIAADVTKSDPPKPLDEFVPNKETAIRIAVAVWSPLYGEKNIERQKPYTAKLKSGVWHVAGSHHGPGKGGVATAEIQRSNAAILRVSHGK